MTIKPRLIMCAMVVVCCVSCTPGPADPEISSTTQVDDAAAINLKSRGANNGGNDGNDEA